MSFQIIKNILLILFTQTFNSSCPKGCLKCLKNDICFLCDFINGYFLDNNQCIIKSIQNCSIYDKKGSCIKCSPQNFLSQSNQCTTIYNEALIENCKNYITLRECEECYEGYYIESSACTKYESFIPNCQVYNTTDKKLCSKCKDGFTNTADFKTCTEIPLKKNCLVFNKYKCQVCIAGYILDRNSYFTKLFDFVNKNNNNLLFEFKTATSQNKFSSYRFKQCISVTIPNCAKVNENDYSKCVQCNTEYFLTENMLCQKQPQEPIQKCKIYSNSITCIECEEKFFLENATTCKSVQTIENCILYDTKANTSKCSQCSSIYFLSTNSCTLRVSSKNISFCLKYNQTKDECETCIQNYVLNSTKLLCQPGIVHCNNYSSSNPLTCSSCDKGYYLTNGKCLSGSVPNCEIYQTISNVCQTCLNGFFQSKTQCFAHQQMKNCKNFHETQKDQCSECFQPSLIFQQNNFCIKSPELENCLLYEEISNQVLKCKSCKPGYVLNPEFTCQFWSDSNCLKISNNQCTQCAQNFILQKETYFCVSPYKYYYKDCHQSTKISEHEMICNVCKEKTYPFQLVNYDVCLETGSKYFVPITNCKRYQRINNQMSCIECDNELYFDVADNICKTFCDKKHVLIELNFNTSLYYTYKNKLNLCKNIVATTNQTVNQPAIETNCEKVMLVSELTVPIYKCTFCKKFPNTNIHFNYITLNSVKNESHIAFYSRIKNSGINYFPQFRENFVFCDYAQNYKFFNTTFELSSTTLISNCDQYIKESFNYTVTNTTYDVFKCIRCKIGFTGLLRDGYIQNCDKTILKCQAYTEIRNLLSPFVPPNIPQNFEPLQIYTSCYACEDNLIPVLFMTKETTQSTYKIFNWNKLQQDQTGNHMECLGKNSTAFQLAVNATFTSVVENCGFVYYDTKNNAQALNMSSADLNDTNLNIYCAACNPGYKPIYNTTLDQNNFIRSCQLIGNCQLLNVSIQMFNFCLVCKSGYGFKYSNITKTLDYTICEVYNDSNCLIQDSANNNICITCKNGFILNKDDKCEKMIIKQCYDDRFRSSVFPYSITGNLKENLYQATLGHGCSMCDSFSAHLVISHQICVASPYLTDTSPLPTTTKFILNCDKYQINQNATELQLKCSVCVSRYVVKNDFLTCYINTNLTNCQKAISENSCEICNTGFITVNNKCESPTILNCKTYQTPSTALTCTSCNDQFFLENNTCVEGQIIGCKTYQDPLNPSAAQNSTNCFECIEDFHLAEISGGKKYCFPIPKSKNCKKFNPTDFSQKKLTCQICKEGFVINLNLTDFKQNDCLSANIIPHCTSYDIQTSISGSTFNCLQCDSSYYIKNSMCIKRQFRHSLCTIFKNDQEECLQCNIGYFPSDDKKSCIPFPKGIFGCARYQNETTCLQCKNQYYLSQNTCLTLTIEQIIANCDAYGENLNCLFCKSGFFLKTNQCVAMIAQNCQTKKDENTCETCASNEFGLKLENGVTNCVQKNISNCAESTEIEPFKCIYCNQGFYVNSEGTCLAVSTAVQNCLIYEQDKLCKVCIQGYLLKSNKLECVQMNQDSEDYDPNCHSYEENVDLNCHICEFGYFFDKDGNCNKCSENDSASGCMSCNPKNTKECFMCDNGFYQKSLNENCQALIQAVAQKVNAMIFIWKITWMMISLFLF